MHHAKASSLMEVIMFKNIKSLHRKSSAFYEMCLFFFLTQRKMETCLYAKYEATRSRYLAKDQKHWETAGLVLSKGGKIRLLAPPKLTDEHVVSRLF